jgi:hypothetical protein
MGREAGHVAEACVRNGLITVRLKQSLSGALEPLVIYWFTLLPISERVV